MSEKLKIGDPVIAHKFTSIPWCPWCYFMEKYDGASGVIAEVAEHCVGVEFADTDMYFFPFDAVEPVYSIEKRRPFKRGEKVVAQKFKSTSSLTWWDVLEGFVGKPAIIEQELDEDGDYGLLFDEGVHRYFPASAVFPFEESPEVVEIKRAQVNHDDSKLVVTRRGFPLGGVPELFISPPPPTEIVVSPEATITAGDWRGIYNHTCVYSQPEPPAENPHALTEWLRKPLTHGRGKR